MAASGISVNNECLEVYQALKLGKKMKYIIFNINSNNTEIVVDKKSESKEYDDFIADLPELECRWAVYDFEYKTDEGGIRNKLCFYMWSPDTAKIKNKMLFASSKDALRKRLDGIAIEVQGTEFSEVAHECSFGQG
ncbi:actin depolymerizing factor [Rhodocollybia butyracea]|uniref:Cofilin n=1 Tax=Rhodocollybia butyracea TaxID=206335 RepID=A0A9P5PQJ4_9AGAR|nr:actin depolymerizing factor [Rhodocollybia butyracea]